MENFGLNTEEKPLVNEQVDDNMAIAENNNGLKNAIGKAAAIGAIAVATLSGEGCKPTDNSAENQEFAREASKVLNSLNQENEKQQEKLLANYYHNINGSAEQSHNLYFGSQNGVEESKARAWDIVKKKGMFKNGSDGKINIKFKKIGLVPVEIEVNGEPVPVGHDDYSKEELNMANRADLIVENSDNSLKGVNPDTEKKAQTTEPTKDSRKPFVSSPDGF